MNAREKLFLVASGDMPVTGDEVNEAIDAYAHELAGVIRAWADSDEVGILVTMITTPHESSAVVRGVARLMATLIDPEGSARERS